MFDFPSILRLGILVDLIMCENLDGSIYCHVVAIGDLYLEKRVNGIMHIIIVDIFLITLLILILYEISRCY